MLHQIRRFFTVDFVKLRATRQGLPLFVDLLMIILVIINLSLIFFDWSFSYQSFRSVIEFISPTFEHWYRTTIHPNASFLDLIFVSIFITELLVRWGLAIRRRTYDKWFFYPFIHWYDVLGCIPMSGTLKLFRLLRIIGMVIRLNNLGIIDLKSTYLYRKSIKYVKIFIEEVSDRVVTNVIEGIQDEVKKDNPVVHKIASQVLIPKQAQINDWLNDRLSDTVSMTYYKHRNDIHNYLKETVTKSVYENPEIKRISLIPGIGRQIALALDSSISNITFNVIDNTIEDIAKNKRVHGIEDITSSLFGQFTEEHPDNERLNTMMKEIVNESLEIIKQQVRVKQWRINELHEQKQRLLFKLQEGRGNAAVIHARIALIDEQLAAITG